MSDKKSATDNALDLAITDVVNEHKIYDDELGVLDAIGITRRYQLHTCLFKMIDIIFDSYKQSNKLLAEEAMNEGCEIFQELYLGTTMMDFAKFIVFRKANRKTVEELLSSDTTPDKLREILYFNLDMIK